MKKGSPKPLIKNMRFFYLFLLSSWLLSSISYAQEAKAQKLLKTYLTALKKAEVDTFVVLDWGCVGCAMVSKDGLKAVKNPQIIHVLSQQQEKAFLFKIDERDSTATEMLDSCELFAAIHQYKNALRGKDVFYKKERAKRRKTSPFLPPMSRHFSYEKLTVRMGLFYYYFEIRNEDRDHMGINREQQEWFKATKSVVSAFKDILK